MFFCEKGCEIQIMRRIKWYLNTGFAGVSYSGEIEVDDNATDEEIEEITREEAFYNIDFGWDEVD